MTKVCDVVPTCAGVGGNTKPQHPCKKLIHPSIRWCFTLNNYSEDNVKLICAIVPQQCKYCCFSKEIAPSTGTPHLQGYLEFKKKHRPFEVFKVYNEKNNLCISWQKAKGNKEQNKAYCTKYGKQELFYEYPYTSTYKCKIDKFYPWQDEIKSLIKTEPDDRSINWYWEPVGCAGKTTFQKWCFQNYERVIVLAGSQADMKNGIIEYELSNKCLPRVVLINIPKCQENISFGGIEQIKDMFFYSGKYKGGMVCGANPHVIVFANRPPEEGFNKMSEDRWNIKEIGNGPLTMEESIETAISIDEFSTDSEDIPIQSLTCNFD